MTTLPHVVVLHRWRDRYAEYASYLDHRIHAVTYISTDVGVESLPATAREVVVVPATDDVDVVSGVVGALAERNGPPERIVALKEDDLLVAAQLRAEWGCPGPTVAETTPFRDKLAMCRAVADAGVDVPVFAPADAPSDLLAFAGAHGWPVVLKPRAGSSSAGVVVLQRQQDLPATVSGAMVQAYNPGAVHHVDGVFDGSALATWKVSRYLGSCLGFRAGVPLGSVEIDDDDLHAVVGAFAGRVLRALTAQPAVFHLELFADRDEFRFLEVGARAGGAEVPFLWRELHGYDLNEAAFHIAMGERPPPPAPVAVDSSVGGWLIVPAPAERPCRIERSIPMLGTVPELYAEVVPEEGDVLPAADAYYEHVGGRFRFRGTSTAAVAAAVSKIAAEYRISGTVLGL